MIPAAVEFNKAVITDEFITDGCLFVMESSGVSESALYVFGIPRHQQIPYIPPWNDEDSCVENAGCLDLELVRNNGII